MTFVFLSNFKRLRISSKILFLILASSLLASSLYVIAFSDQYTPQIKLVSPEENSIIGGKINLMVEAEGKYSILEVSLMHKEEKHYMKEKGNKWIYELDTRDYSDGEFIFDIISCDALDHKNKRSFTIFIDNSAPVIEPIGGPSEDSLLFRILDLSGIATTQYSLDGKKWSPLEYIGNSQYTTNSTMSKLEPGIYNSAVYAVDVNGNERIENFTINNIQSSKNQDDSEMTVEELTCWIIEPSEIDSLTSSYSRSNDSSNDQMHIVTSYKKESHENLSISIIKPSEGEILEVDYVNATWDSIGCELFSVYLDDKFIANTTNEWYLVEKIGSGNHTLKIVGYNGDLSVFDSVIFDPILNGQGVVDMTDGEYNLTLHIENFISDGNFEDLSYAYVSIHNELWNVSGAGLTGEKGDIIFNGISSGTWIVKIYTRYQTYRYGIRSIEVNGNTSKTIQVNDIRGKVGMNFGMPPVNYYDGHDGNKIGLNTIISYAKEMDLDIIQLILRVGTDYNYGWRGADPPGSEFGQYTGAYFNPPNHAWWDIVFNTIISEGFEIWVNYDPTMDSVFTKYYGYQYTVPQIKSSSRVASSSTLTIPLASQYLFDSTYNYWTVKDVTDDYQIISNSTNNPYEWWSFDSTQQDLIIHNAQAGHEYRVWYLWAEHPPILNPVNITSIDQMLNTTKEIFDYHGTQIHGVEFEAFDVYEGPSSTSQYNEWGLVVDPKAIEWFLGNYSDVLNINWIDLQKCETDSGSDRTSLYGQYWLQFQLELWSAHHKEHINYIYDHTNGSVVSWYYGDANGANTAEIAIERSMFNAIDSWGTQNYWIRETLWSAETPHIIFPWYFSGNEDQSPDSSWGEGVFNALNHNSLTSTIIAGWTTFPNQNARAQYSETIDAFHNVWSILKQFEAYNLGKVYALNTITSGFFTLGQDDSLLFNKDLTNMPFTITFAPYTLSEINELESLGWANGTILALMNDKHYYQTAINDTLLSLVESWIYSGGALFVTENATMNYDNQVQRPYLAVRDLIGVEWTGEVDIGSYNYIYVNKSSNHWIVEVFDSDTLGRASSTLTWGWNETQSLGTRLLYEGGSKYPLLLVRNLGDGRIAWFGNEKEINQNYGNNDSEEKLLALARTWTWLLNKEDQFKWIYCNNSHITHKLYNNSYSWMISVGNRHGSSQSFTLDCKDIFESGKTYVILQLKDWENLETTMLQKSNGDKFFSQGDLIELILNGYESRFLIIREYNSAPLTMGVRANNGIVNITDESFGSGELDISSDSSNGNSAEFIVFAPLQVNQVMVNDSSVSFVQKESVLKFNASFQSLINIEISFGPDTINPIAQIKTPNENEWIAGYYTISGDIFDNLAVDSIMWSYSSDGSTWVSIANNTDSYIWDTNEFIEESNYYLRVFANDTAGNTANDQIIFNIDNIKPLCSFYSPTQTETVSGSLRIYINASDNQLASVYIIIDSEPAIEITSNQDDGLYYYKMNADDLSEGSHEFRCMAVDLAGNSHTSSPLSLVIEHSNAGSGSSQSDDNVLKDLKLAIEFIDSSVFQGDQITVKISVTDADNKVVVNASVQVEIHDKVIHCYFSEEENLYICTIETIEFPAGIYEVITIAQKSDYNTEKLNYSIQIKERVVFLYISDFFLGIRIGLLAALLGICVWIVHNKRITR